MRISKSVTSFFYNLFLHESNSHLMCRFKKFCKYSSFRLNKFDSVLIESLQENLSRAKKWTFFLIVITSSPHVLKSGLLILKILFQISHGDTHYFLFMKLCILNIDKKFNYKQNPRNFSRYNWRIS